MRAIGRAQSDPNSDSNRNSDCEPYTKIQSDPAASPQPITTPITCVDERVQRVCHDTLPWLISFSLDLMRFLALVVFTTALFGTEWRGEIQFHGFA